MTPDTAPYQLGQAQNILEQRSGLVLLNCTEVLGEQQRLATSLTAEQLLDVRVILLAGEDEQVLANVVARVAIPVMHDLARQ